MIGGKYSSHLFFLINCFVSDSLNACRLLFGFMIVTAFLSMWLSNTATTAMMFPIAQAILHELREGQKDVLKNGVVNNGSNTESQVTWNGKDDSVEMKSTQEGDITEANGEVKYVTLLLPSS